MKTVYIYNIALNWSMVTLNEVYENLTTIIITLTKKKEKQTNNKKKPKQNKVNKKRK